MCFWFEFSRVIKSRFMHNEVILYSLKIIFCEGGLERICYFVYFKLASYFSARRKLFDIEKDDKQRTSS
jgi:hypothetical protein